MTLPDTTTQKLLDKLDALEQRTLTAERRLAGLTAKHDVLVKSLAFLNQKFIDNVDGMLDLHKSLSNSLDGYVRDLQSQIDPLVQARLPRLGDALDAIQRVIGTPAIYAPERLKLRAPLPESDPKPTAKN